MFELLRYGLQEKRGYTCQHEEKYRKFSRKSKQWYCTNCYTFLDIVPGQRSGFNLVPRKPSWEIKKEMTAEEWARMIKPDNKDMK